MEITLSNYRNAPGVDAQAEVTLTTWSVFRDALGDNVLFGFHNGGKTIRMTTPIKEFDSAEMVVTTSSGRRYQLSGPPVIDAEILAAMAVYALQYSVILDADVTEEFWSGPRGLH
jgi:hypothetical protein